MDKDTEKLTEVSEAEEASEAPAAEEAEASAAADTPEAGAEPEGLTEAVRPAKKHHIFRAVLWTVTLIMLAAACTAAYASHLIKEREQECEQTVLPKDLTAEGTVRKYFEYWNAGNNKGMSLAALSDLNTTQDEGAFVAGLYWFCNISLDRCELLPEKAEGFEGCYESAIVSVDFTYERSLGFGDETLPEKNTGWEFYLARLTEDDPYRIYAVKNGNLPNGDES